MDTRKGDIPETDEELEKMLKKQNRQKPVKRTKVKKLSLSEAQLAASGMLPQQQDIVGDAPVVIPSERLQELADAFNAGAPLDQQVKTAKQAYKQSRGRTIDSAKAAEIAQEEGLDENGKKVKAVVLDGNQQVVTDKKMAKAIVRSEQRKVTKAQRSKLTEEQKKRYEALEKAEQPEITEALVVTILQLLGEGKTTIEVRELTRVHYNTIRAIARGKAYTEWSGLGAVATTKEGEK